MNSGSAPKGAPEAATAKQQTRRHLSFASDTPLQLPLPIEPLAYHGADDMKRVVNTLRRDRSHWWIRDVRRHQAECNWCRRCDWNPRAAA